MNLRSRVVAERGLQKQLAAANEVDGQVTLAACRSSNGLTRATP
jgi:hypothetical protein